MSKVNSRSNWKFGDRISNEYSLDDLIDYYIGYMLSRTLEMFKWKNLPDGMNSYDVEKFTQLKGETFLLYDSDKKRYFILEGSAYDNITWNYEPSKSIIVNPALPEINGILYKLGENAVMIRNDYLRIGLYPMLEKNAIELANTDLSIKFANFNVRLKSVMKSNDDNTKDSLNTLINDVWQGKRPTAIVTDDLYHDSLEGVQYNTTQNNDIHQLIELKQYQLAHWYMELCINANYNMKSQYVNEGEMVMNDDALLPLMDQMLECRKMACDEINKLFGLDISVELNSSWLKKRKEVEIKMKEEKLENEILENQAESNESNEGGEEDANKSSENE